MPGAAAAQPGGKNAPKAEDTSGKVNEIKQMTRRRIYYHRLIGDDALVPRKTSQATAPIRQVARFLVYVVIATWVITVRSDIPTLADVNLALRHAMTSIPFQGGSKPKYFEDIASLQEMSRWLQQGLVARARANTDPANGGAYLLNHNRIMPPMLELCTNNASAFVFTMNRMQITTSAADTTTSRFEQLYPSTWKRPGHSPDGSKDDATTDTLMKSYTPLSAAFNCVPEELRGTLNPNVTFASYEVNWSYTPSCDDHGQESDCGFAGAGGYVAVLLFVPSGADCTGGIERRLVALLGPNEDAKGPYPELGICNPVKVSHIVPFEDFLSMGFYDIQLTTFVVSFTSYNANHQTVSEVAAAFNQRSSGFLRKPELTINSVKMDIYHPYLQYVEIAYLLGTICYLLDLVVRFWRNHMKHIVDLWAYINLASILCSSLSLFFWYIYESETLDHLDLSNRPLGQEISELGWHFRHYLRAGAFATLTIYIRMLQMLGNTKPRVQLLLTTLSQSVKNMFIYIVFISVVFLGCYVFATTYFSAYSSNFADLQTAFTTCFLMVFGDTALFTFQRNAPLELLFYIPYMFFFFIFSVQMFNAIINYAYNKVSEGMEPAFERERIEKRRKLSTARNAKGKRSALHQWCAPLAQVFTRVRHREAQDKKEDASDMKGKQGGTKPGDKVDPQTKDAVEEKILKEKNQRPPETICSLCLYIVFALSYLTFLWVNIKVEDSSMVMQSMRRAFLKTPTYEVYEDADVAMFTLENVSDMQQMESWVGGALPSILFDNQDQPQTVLTTGSLLPQPGQYCIGTWNCIVTRAMNSTITQPKIVRITQRMLKVMPNTGSRGHSNSTPANERFDAGAYLTAVRSSSQDLIPTAGEVDQEDRDTELTLSYNGTTFCSRVPYGSGGFRDKGGIVCFLDADRDRFMQQLNIMRMNSFFGSHTGSATIELMAHNANANMMTTADISFSIKAGGLVLPTFHTSSFLFINIREWRRIYLDLMLQIVPGLVYLCLTFTFIVYMGKDLQNEIMRRRRNESKRHTLRIIVDYFTQDVFNAIDLISFMISLASSLLYILWLAQETSLDIQVYYTHLLKDITGLEEQALVYRQLSAINSLIIFIRPLKFLRENPRISMFNQTLWEAAEDTSWFVVMLFITMIGFMMFAYVSFGHLVERLSTIEDAFVFCFYHILGEFEFDSLNRSDPLLSWVWFIPYIFVFYCFFLNMFFAIIDRYFVTAEPQPVNFKRKLKPIFSRLCRWIEWDEDYVMDVDQKTKAATTTTVSRRRRVQITAEKMQAIRDRAYDDGAPTLTGGPKRSKQLGDVCDQDERMNSVLFWSKEEAKTFVDEYTAYANKKQAERSSEEMFMKALEAKIKERQQLDKETMEKAERHKRYAIQVHERMVMKDQETLARYILTLERKIQEKMLQKHRLHMEVHHLRAESEKMRFTDQELKNSEEGDDAPLAQQAGGKTGPRLQAVNALEPHQEAEDEEEVSDSNSDESINQDDTKQLAARHGADPEGRMDAREDRKRNADGLFNAVNSHLELGNGQTNGNGHSVGNGNTNGHS